MKLTYIAIITLFFAFHLVVLGQSPIQDTTYKPDAAIRNASRVDPLTLGMSLQIPLGSYPGRAGTGLPISLSYASKSLWRVTFDADFGSASTLTNEYETFFSEKNLVGWTSSLTPPALAYDWGSYETQFGEEWYSQGGYPGAHMARIRVLMPDGSSHELRKDDAYHAIDTTNSFFYTGSYYAVDGSPMRFDCNGSSLGFGTLYLPDGSRYIFAGGVVGYYATQYIDRNGNKLTYNATSRTWTDTMGRTFGPILPQSISAPTDTTYTMPGIDSQELTYTLKWRYLVDLESGNTILTNPAPDPADSLAYPGDRDCTILPHPPAITSPHLFSSNSHDAICAGNEKHNPILLSEIVLPNGQSYHFTYNAYGEIDKVWYPTGTYESFVYSRVQPMSSYKVPYEQGNRGVTQHRISSDGTTNGEVLWQYTSARDYNVNYRYFTTITAPDGTVTERSTYANWSSWVPFGIEEARVGKIFDEKVFAPASQGGGILRRSMTNWTEDGPLSGGVSNATRNARSLNEVDIVFENGESNALASMTQTVYDTTGNSDIGYFSSLNAKQKKKYNYLVVDASSAASADISSALVWFTGAYAAVTTEADYLYDSNYKARNITGLVTETRVRDASNNIVAKTQMTYDDSSHTESSSGTMPSAASGSWLDPVTELGSTLGVKRGNPTIIKKYYDIANSSYIQAENFFDQFGNLRKARDGRGNDTWTTYDASYAFCYPTSATSSVPDSNGTYGSNAAFTTSSVYDYSTGLPLTTNDANGEVTQMDYVDPATNTYDSLLRLHKVTSPNGHQTITDYGDGTSESTRWVKVRSQIDGTQWSEAKSFYDPLGRTYKTQKTDVADSQGDVFTFTCYDEMGRVAKSSNPFRNVSSPTCSSGLEWATSEYDDLSRTKKVTSSDTNNVQIAYGLSTTGVIGTTKTLTDQAGRQRTGITDALGNMIRVIEDPGSGHQNLATDYLFDTLGNLRKTTQGNQHRYFMYDSLGRVLYAKQVEQDANTAFSGSNFTDPITSNNQWSAKYTYDNNSNIATTTDARNNTITATYDRLNRITNRQYSDSATPNVTFYYDGKGLATSPEDALGKTTKVTSSVSETRNTTFDNMGRITESQQITDGKTYGFTYSYNSSGALIQETYPSGRVVKNTLDGNGDLGQVQSKKNSGSGYWTYASGFQYNAAGSVTKVQLGNGHWETAVYNDRQQVKQIGLGTVDTGQDILKLDFEYTGPTTATGDKNNGSMRKQTITVPTVGTTTGFTAVQTYDYDALNRLQAAEEKVSNTTSWKQTFTYDRYGNRNFDAANTTTLGSCSTAVCNPVFDTAENNRFSLTGQSYTYDAAGSITHDASGQRFSFDAENRQKAYFAANNNSSTPNANYSYDGEGKRVKNQSTIFVYDTYGHLAAEYEIPGPAVEGPPPAVSYLTSDHLGSTRIVTDANGSVVSRKDFSAFGDETATSQRTADLGYNSPDIRQDYTGYQKDAESGLEYAQARYYNTKHGRFTSVDPLPASAAIRDPQTFNRYSYAGNSPYKFTDPLGLAYTWCGPEHGSCDDGEPGGTSNDATRDENDFDQRLQNTRDVIAGMNALHKGDQEGAEAICASNANLECQREQRESTTVTVLEDGSGDEPSTGHGSVILADGESGTGIHNTGQNLRRAVITASENLQAADFRPLYFGPISTVNGLQGLLDMADKFDAGSIFLFVHGNSENLFVGNGKPTEINTITMNNIKRLVNRASSLTDIRIFGCNAGATSNGIAAALAKQLGVTIYAATGGMIFSNLPDKPSGLKVHPNSGPTYLVHNGGDWREFRP